MLPETIRIAPLRARAKALRDKADAIDASIDGILAMVAMVEQLDLPDDLERYRKPLRQTASHIETRNPAAIEKRPGGKKPGTISMRWRDHFNRIYEVAGRDEFPTGLVQDVIKEREGRDVQPSQVNRLFKNYVKHGYATQTETDKFRLTDKLLELIRASDSPTAEPVLNENAPSGSPDGADTALLALDGRPQE